MNKQVKPIATSKALIMVERETLEVVVEQYAGGGTGGEYMASVTYKGKELSADGWCNNDAINALARKVQAHKNWLMKHATELDKLARWNNGDRWRID